MPKPTPEQLSLKRRLAAHTKWSKYDPVEGTRAARKAQLERFIDEVDPHGELPEHERIRRAESAKKAHYLRMAIRSAEVRRSRKQTES